MSLRPPLATFGAMVLAILGTAIACANTSTECEAGFTPCSGICCQTQCVGGACEAPAGGSTSSGGSGRSGTDPRCAQEQDISKTMFCTSVGKCIDPQSTDEHCGQCDNVCGTDTNGNQLSCIIGRCR